MLYPQGLAAMMLLAHIGTSMRVIENRCVDDLVMCG